MDYGERIAFLESQVNELRRDAEASKEVNRKEHETMKIEQDSLRKDVTDVQIEAASTRTEYKNIMSKLDKLEGSGARVWSIVSTVLLLILTAGQVWAAVVLHK